MLTSDLQRFRSTATRCGPLLGLWLLSAMACDEPGGSAHGQSLVATDASEVTQTVDVVADTASEVVAPSDGGAETTVPETTVPETTVPEVADATPPETTAGDGVSSVCAVGCLPLSTLGAPTGVDFRQVTNQGWPLLRGGSAPSAGWVLDAVTIYTQGTFAQGISVSFADHGATAGRIAFEGDAIAMALDLDLEVTVTAFGSSGSDSARSAVSLGGCHEVVGARLRGNLGTCGGGLDTAESALDFELGAAGLVIGVEVARESLIALLPPDQQGAGELAVVGPMYLVATFVRP